MSNTKDLTPEQNARVEKALATAKAKAAAAQANSDKAIVEKIAAATTPAPAKVVPNKPKAAPKPEAKKVDADFADSIKVIEVLPARQKDAEIIDAVIVEDDAPPMAKGKAEALDKKIVATISGIGDSIEKLEKLVAEAKEGKIHVALGFASWTAYFADRVQMPFAKIGDRQTAALMLHEEGMSSRVIGATLGVSPATVVNDVRKAKGDKEKKAAAEGKTITPAKPGKTVGKDGKSYTRTAPKPKPQPKPQPKKSDLEARLDIVTADAENIVDDITTLAANLEKLYATEGYTPGMDKAVQALLTKARKALAATALPKAPARKAVKK